MMKTLTGFVVLVWASIVFIAVPAAQEPAATSQAAPDDPDKPVWAYAVAPGARIAGPGGRAAGPGAAGRGAGRGAGARAGGGGQPADAEKYTLPGSRFSFTRAEVRNAFGPADWFPEDHPAMPEVVSHGRAPGARACGFCHMPNGKGRPENAPIAGLPKAYILQQLADFASGARVTAEPRKPNDMTQISQNITPEDFEESAEYFASMKWTPWIRVVETDTVKKTRIAGQMYHLVDDGTTEPIGVRIVEAPENEDEEQLRAPRTGFVAYVPVGSLKRGEDLVKTGGNGRTIACTTCHGQKLEGVGPIPPLAGRSPSYLARQIWDIRRGARHGAMAELMKPVVANLTNRDLVDIFAFTASQMP